MLGIFRVGFDKKKQGWHDKLAGTYVVKGSLTSGAQSQMRLPMPICQRPFSKDLKSEKDELYYGLI